MLSYLRPAIIVLDFLSIVIAPLDTVCSEWKLLSDITCTVLPSRWSNPDTVVILVPVAFLPESTNQSKSSTGFIFSIQYIGESVVPRFTQNQITSSVAPDTEALLTIVPVVVNLDQPITSWFLSYNKEAISPSFLTAQRTW